MSELEMRANYLDKPIESIYFGGGSPSLLTPKQVAQWLSKIGALLAIESNVEITMEINPDDASAAYLKALRQEGVNRISMGVQSFNEDHLQLMNRLHTAHQSLQALEHTAAFFNNFSIDLIYGIPNESMDRWREDIENALHFNPTHISAYALTVEPKTVLAHQVEKGQILLLDDVLVKEQFDFLVAYLTQAEFEHYEVSNFGKLGFHSVNNSNYWIGKPYLGIGPGAHSYDGKKTRSWNVSNNALYVKGMDEGTLPQESEILSKKELFNEFLMTRLRTHWGVSLPEVTKHFGDHFAAYLEQQAEKHIALRRLFWDGDCLKINQQTRFLSDGIASDLFLL